MQERTTTSRQAGQLVGKEYVSSWDAPGSESTEPVVSESLEVLPAGSVIRILNVARQPEDFM